MTAAPMSVGPRSAAPMPLVQPSGGPSGTGPLYSQSSLLLPDEHFAAATFYLTLGSAGLVWVAPELAAGTYLAPRVAAVTHLFTLGWLSMMIMGALYQLLPVALGAPVRSRRVAHVGFAAFTLGVASFVCGIAIQSVVLHHIGIGLLTIGISVFVATVARALSSARARDATWAAIAIAVMFFASTLVLGGVLLHDLHTGALGARRLEVLAIHIHVALVGWVLMMIVGVSHRLLPMFLLSHGVGTGGTRTAIVALTSGLLMLSLGLARESALASWTGLALLELGVLSFLWQSWRCFQARGRKTLDVGLRFAAIALCFLALAAALGPGLLTLGAQTGRLASVYIVLGLLGGLVLYVIGFFYKIAPMLVWIARFRSRIGRERVPTVASLYSARLAHVQLVLMTLGVVGVALGIALGSRGVTASAALGFCAGVAVLLKQLTRIMWGPAQ